MRNWLLPGALAITLVAVRAEAATVTFNYSGTLTEVAAALSPTLNVGQTFSGSFSYDLLALPDPIFGIYPNLGVVFHSGAYSAAVPGNGIVVRNNFSIPSGDSILFVGASSGAPPIAGLTSEGIGILFVDASSTVFDTTVLHTLPATLSLSSFTSALIFGAFSGPTGRFEFQGTITSLELAQTPLPGALPLFASALGVAGLVSWKRRRRPARSLRAV